MKINLLERSKSELRIELVGEGHTFCNALQETLLKDETIDFASYNISHPLIAQPILYVRVKDRGKPETVLIEGSKNLIKGLSSLQEAFRKAFKDAKTPSPSQVEDEPQNI